LSNTYFSRLFHFTGLTGLAITLIVISLLVGILAGILCYILVSKWNRWNNWVLN